MKRTSLPLRSRREVITLLGVAAASGAGAATIARGRVPQRFSPATDLQTLASVREGLDNSGYIEHQNVGFEYRWAEGRYDPLAALSADLVRREGVADLHEPYRSSTHRQGRNETIPVVFLIVGDPVQLGLVASLAHPVAISQARHSMWPSLHRASSGCCMSLFRRQQPSGSW